MPKTSPFQIKNTGIFPRVCSRPEPHSPHHRHPGGWSAGVQASTAWPEERLQIGLVPQSSWDRRNLTAASGGREKEALAMPPEVFPVASTHPVQQYTDGLPDSVAARIVAGTFLQHLSYHLSALRILETHPGVRNPNKSDNAAEDQTPGKGSLGSKWRSSHRRTKGLRPTPPVWDFVSRYTQGTQGRTKAAQEASVGPTRGRTHLRAQWHSPSHLNSSGH